MIGRYHNAPYGSLPPHCFQEAEDAFSSLQKTRRNQAVVICGESGAGKTETTKLMLHYLAVVAKSSKPSRRSSKGGAMTVEGAENDATIAERMVASNPVRNLFALFVLRREPLQTNAPQECATLCSILRGVSLTRTSSRTAA